jgi:hypothetical protein
LGKYGCGTKKRRKHVNCLRSLLDQHGPFLAKGATGQVPLMRQPARNPAKFDDGLMGNPGMNSGKPPMDMNSGMTGGPGMPGGMTGEPGMPPCIASAHTCCSPMVETFLGCRHMPPGALEYPGGMPGGPGMPGGMTGGPGMPGGPGTGGPAIP